MKYTILILTILFAGRIVAWAEISDPSRQMQIVRDVQKAERVQAQRDQLASKGDQYVVSFDECSNAGCSQLSMTVETLRKAGYEVRIADDGGYIFAKGNAEIADLKAQKWIIRDVREAERIQAQRDQLTSKGDQYVVSFDECSNAGCSQLSVTVGELRRAGYDVRIDDDGKYVFSLAGVETQPRSAVQKAISLKQARADEKMKTVTGRIQALAGGLDLQ